MEKGTWAKYLALSSSSGEKHLSLSLLILPTVETLKDSTLTTFLYLDRI